MKENFIQVLLLLVIMAVATGTTAVINFIQGNELQGATNTLLLCNFFILAGMLAQQNFHSKVLKVVGKSHFALVKSLKKAIKNDEDDNEEVEIPEEQLDDDGLRIKRMCEEYDYLAGRYERLTNFLASDKFKTLSVNHCILLKHQHKAMHEYMEALKQRIELECDNNNKKEG